MTGSRVPVLVVGAGPVGLGVGNELGQRGVRCVVVDRALATTPLPKMNHVNARSMELCRRWGLAERVRKAGWPEDHPLDVAYVTSLAGYEIARFAFPSQREKRDDPDTPEPSQRCPQIWFDPILEEGLARFPGVELRRGLELVGLRDEGGGVVAELRDVRGGGREEIACDWLVGADGAGSAVRELAGIARQSWGPAPQQVAIALRTPALERVHGKRPAAFFWVVDAEGPRGLVTPTDARELWRFNWNLRPGETLASFDAGSAVRTLAGTGLACEIVAVLAWQIRFTLAERYRKGRVLLAGDAARTLSPTGGLGMNTGLADAADLGWKLAAHLAGWGGEALLDGYDAERRATGRRINEESLRNLGRVAAIPRLAAIAEAGPAGEAARAEARCILEEGDFRLEWMNEGAVLGARYAGSPLVVGDDSPPPPDDPNRYHPSSFPGCRAPHAWLPDGRSTLDLFGMGFVLLQLGDAPPDASALVEAAGAAGVPLALERLPGAELAKRYERALVLVRPDGIVAWRGDAPPAEPAALLDRVRGTGP